MNTTQKEFSISEAEKRLSSIIHGVEAGCPVRLTRLGRPVVALIPIHEHEREKNDFWEELMSLRRITEHEGIEFYDSDFEGSRDASPGREVVRF